MAVVPSHSVERGRPHERGRAKTLADGKRLKILEAILYIRKCGMFLRQRSTPPLFQKREELLDTPIMLAHLVQLAKCARWLPACRDP